MSFVSGSFFILLAGLFAVYFLLGKLNSRYQWAAVLAASLIYYGSAMKLFSVYLAAAVFISWVYGIIVRIIEKKQETALLLLPKNEESKEEKKTIRKRSENTKKAFLFCVLLLLLGTLIILKCCTAFLPVHESRFYWLQMPLGISFFTFLCVGYCIDVYRGTVTAEASILKHALYVSFFPHVGQGPLDRYEILAQQFTNIHRFDRANFALGTERALIGYFKKLVIANHLALFIDPVFADPGKYSGVVLAFAAFMYAFQIYADFSGYMDIACGLSQCMGIKLSENFRAPYFSKSIAEYWRRWHITLGAWFRDYLYYPILRSGFVSGISKRIRTKGYKKFAKDISTAIGLFATWLLIGFWHGTSMNFIVHGLFHGSIIFLSTVLAASYSKIRSGLHIDEQCTAWKLFQILRTFIIVCIGYILFRSDSLETALIIFGRIITRFYYNGWSNGLISDTLDRFYWISMFVGIVIMFLMDLIEVKESFSGWLNRQRLPVRWSVLYVFMLSVLFVVVFSNVQEAGAGNFIYYNF